MKSTRGGKREGAGRPRGAQTARPKSARVSLSELAREHTSTALGVLIEVAKKGQTESARVAAANAILDRGYGRPAQSHEHTGAGGGPIQSVDLTNLSEADIDRLESIFGPLAGSGDDDEIDQSGEGETPAAS